MTASLPRRTLLLSALALPLGGCAAVSAIGGAATPLDAFDLRLPPGTGPRAAGGPLARALIVELPEVTGALDTDRILIRPTPLQAQYLPAARWAEPAADMMQTLLVRTLEDSGALRYVGRQPLGASGDFALVASLTDFQAELGAGGAVLVRIRLSARLVREEDISVLASRVFEAVQPAPSTEAQPLVEAFNAAAARLVPEVSVWALRAIGARLAS